MLTRNACICDHCNETISREPEEHGFLQVTWGDEHLVFCCVHCLLLGMTERDRGGPMEAIPL